MSDERSPQSSVTEIVTTAEDVAALSFEDVLTEVSATFARVPPGAVSREIERCLRYAVLTLDIDRATVGEINPLDGLMYTTHQWARDGIRHTPYKMNVNEKLPWLAGKLFADETVVVDDVEDLPPEAAKDLEYAHWVGCRSNVTVPLKIEGVVVGGVAFDAVNQQRRWSERTTQRLRLLTQLFGNALERERAVSEILRLAEEVRKSSSTAKMGELTASLAHELNQPLGAILSNAQAARRFLAAKKPDLEEVKAAIEEIIHDNSRAVETLRNVRALFRRDQIEMSPLDLRQVLLEAERVLDLEARSKGISIRSDFPHSLPAVVGNRAQLTEVIMNLVANAFDSICDDEKAARVIDLSAGYNENGHVRVTVHDSGKGIDPEIMPRLFDAFFTTKPGGMGIGLRIARSIIEKHGGRLWAEPNPDCGAALIFELPVRADEQERK